MILIDLVNRETYHWVLISSIIISPSSLFQFFFSDACIMTRAAVFLNRFFYKVWFFGACYYWGTWVFLVVSFDITLLFLSLNRMFFLFFWCGLDFHLVSQFESQLIKLLQRENLWPSLTDLSKNERFSSLVKLMQHWWESENKNLVSDVHVDKGQVIIVGR